MMFARWVLCSLRLGARPSAEKLADRLASLYGEQAGFKGISVLIEETLGDYAILTFWDTKENAQAAGERVPAEREEEFASRLQGPPVVRIFDVYEPSSSGVSAGRSVDGRGS